MRTVILTIIAVLVALIAAGGIVLGTGAYNVAADEPHTGLTFALIGVLREQSIEARSGGVDVPNLDDPQLLSMGAGHYAEMCTACHLAPGMSNTELREGLYPTPPDLSKMKHVDPAEAFWIIKHGIKFTAMPAWGKTHDDQKIWAMVAFLKRLPTLSPDEYKAMVDAAPADDDDDHDHHE